MKEALVRLDGLMNRLVEADQTGSGIDPLRIANELGQIRQLLAEAPAVVRAKGGQKHFRCEACGTISHGEHKPERCPTCGGRKFFAAGIEQPLVGAGAGESGRFHGLWEKGSVAHLVWGPNSSIPHLS